MPLAAGFSQRASLLLSSGCQERERMGGFEELLLCRAACPAAPLRAQAPCLVLMLIALLLLQTARRRALP